MKHLRVSTLLVSLVIALTVATLWAQEAQQFQRGINVIRGNVTTSAGYVFSGGSVVRDFRTNTAINGAAATYTAAQVLGGLITRTPTPGGGNVIDVMPTAANLIAAIPGVNIGHAFELIVDLDTSPGGTVTINGASTGVTYSGSCTVALTTPTTTSLGSMRMEILVTSLTAYRVICVP